jgi:hypothetical protein
MAAWRVSDSCGFASVETDRAYVMSQQPLRVYMAYMTTQFCVPQWTTTSDPHALGLAEVSNYADRARERGLADTDIGVEITIRWPGTVPGGVRIAVLLAAVSAYVNDARSCGLDDEGIGNTINVRWPGLIPGGAEVITDDLGVIWVTSTRLIDGQLPANH